MTAEQILGLLGKVRKNGTSWMALCPGHEDRNPSLAITETDGKVLLQDLTAKQLGPA